MAQRHLPHNDRALRGELGEPTPRTQNRRKPTPRSDEPTAVPPDATGPRDGTAACGDVFSRDPIQAVKRELKKTHFPALKPTETSQAGGFASD